MAALFIFCGKVYEYIFSIIERANVVNINSGNNELLKEINDCRSGNLIKTIT